MSAQKIEFIAVDFQKDFTLPNRACYVKGDSIDFIKKTLVPYLVDKKIKVHEIISDYRLPRLKSKGKCCNPNDDGFESDLPVSVKHENPWLKCMHSPLWTRKNIGLSGVRPGTPYQDPALFDQWLKEHIGVPTGDKLVVLFGLTMEICVLSVAQELYFRGYRVVVVYECTDPMNERLKYKEFIAYHSSLSLYAKAITFEELKTLIDGDDING